MKRGGVLLLLLFQSLFSLPVFIDMENQCCSIEGISFPMVGFGTYPLRGKICKDAVAEAASCGYRILDTATFYENFEPIGEFLKGRDRSSFYLISKVWRNMQSPAALRKDLEKTLKLLQVDCLDCYLLHWPNCGVSIECTLAEMEKLRREKKIRHIGLSNVTVHHVRRALEVGVPITWVQVEMHPGFCDFALLEFCQKNKICIQAWGPLGCGRLCDDPLLRRIGKKYDKTPAQVALRWILQHRCVPIPGSKNQKHICQNFDVFNFCLTTDEMGEIDRRACKGDRIRISEEFAGFSDEFDFTYDQCWPK